MTSPPLHWGVLAVAMAATASPAGTISVPHDHASIGAAIAAAVPGDVVLVEDGVYTGPDNRDLTFGGKDIVVRSLNGPAACVIDCQGLGRGFIFDDGETHAAVLEGFTIQNGSAPTGNGGGIDIALSTSPTIRHCVLRDNTAAALGGGMAVRGQCTPIIDRCTFINNASFGSEESSEGGGLCLFFLCPATVSNCVFVDNYSDYGGGLSCALSDATIVNCLFVGNTAAIGGGAVASDVSSPTLVNCTITGNSATYGGGAAGITQYLESNLNIENCILWNDTPNEIVVNNGIATVRYSDVQGGWSGVGVIDASPGFSGSTSPLNPEEYTLIPGSPCIDAGDSAAVPGGVTTDLADQPRFVDDPDTPDSGSGPSPVVDMGAFEFQVLTCAADLSADGEVDVTDLLLLLSNWDGPDGDVDGDGITGIADLLALLAAWGSCP